MAKCCSTHAAKMCSLTCCPCHLDLKAVRALVKGAKYICKACGRVAAKKENLCKPATL